MNVARGIFLCGVLSSCAVNPQTSEEVAVNREAYGRARVIEKIYAKEIAVARVIPFKVAELYRYHNRPESLDSPFEDQRILSLVVQDSYTDSDDCITRETIDVVYRRPDVRSLRIVGANNRSGARLESGGLLVAGRYQDQEGQHWKSIAVKFSYPDSSIHTVLHLDPKSLPSVSWAKEWQEPLQAHPVDRFLKSMLGS